jgi:hypothetical protein
VSPIAQIFFWAAVLALLCWAAVECMEVLTARRRARPGEPGPRFGRPEESAYEERLRASGAAGGAGSASTDLD